MTDKPKTVAVPAAEVLAYYGLGYVSDAPPAPVEQSAEARAKRLVDAAARRVRRQMRNLARRGGA